MARRANHKDVMSKSAPGRFSPAKNMPERRCLRDWLNLSLNVSETWAKPHSMTVFANFEIIIQDNSARMLESRVFFVLGINFYIVRD